ncbi:hypothetical protein FQZ97_775200 [compost metagenome]
MHAQQFRRGVARGFIEHLGIEDQRIALSPEPGRAAVHRLVALGGGAFGVHELHFMGFELALGQGVEQADHRASEHFREVPVACVLAEGKHGALGFHVQLRIQGVGEQAHIAQGVTQPFAEGAAGEKEVFQEQAMEGRQVPGQVEADMLFAAFVGGGFPELGLGSMGETTCGQAARWQAHAFQNLVRVGAAGTQGVDHRAHQRHIVGQITHHFLKILIVCGARPSYAASSPPLKAAIDCPAARLGPPANVPP